MLIDGKAIADDILKAVMVEVSALKRAPKMSAITCEPKFETKKYLKMKKQKAASVGIDLDVIELSSDVSTEEVIECVKKASEDSDGVVVQLPFPEHIDRDKVLEAVSHHKDPDGFKYGLIEDACLSPVVGAIDEISKKHSVEWKGKLVIVLGGGRLVGLPAAYYAEKKGGLVKVLTEKNFSEEILAEADIIITGIGKPKFIGTNLVKEGVVIFDAGTSEDGGELVGDADPLVSEKTSLLTPVPGGIGPITIAYLLRNLVKLMDK